MEYIRSKFAEAGLKPGHGTTFFQSVPLVEITAAPDTSLTFERAGTKRELKYAQDMVVWTKRVVSQSSTAARWCSSLRDRRAGVRLERLRCGRYQGQDCRHSGQRPGLCDGRSEAVSRPRNDLPRPLDLQVRRSGAAGAAGALIIHETEPAAYGWNVVATSWTGPQLDMASSDGNAGRVAIEGWISEEATRFCFSSAVRISQPQDRRRATRLQGSPT